MYTLNLLEFEQRVVLNNVNLDAYLKQIPLRITRISLDSATRGQVLPSADINLFVCSSHLLDQPEPYQKLCGYLSNASASINLCLIPEGDTLNNELVARFHDFLLWPCSATEFHTRLTRLLSLRQHPDADQNPLLTEFTALNLIGKSPLFLENVRLIKKMSACQAAVLIQGETGTGKENAARAIHYLSKRMEQSFVPVNCAAIPDELLESELFGHQKGAFTDAKQTQVGLVTIANGGTLFLDEVDSLTPKAQAALLRFLQTQEYRPLGAKQTLFGDVRILAATNADLKTLVANKQFREDLYFRLNVLNLTMPPLRERADDILLIANNLLYRFSLEHQTNPKKLSNKGIAYLKQHSWPGNIRELENYLLREFLLSPGKILELEAEQTLETAVRSAATDFVCEKTIPDIVQSMEKIQSPEEVLPLSFHDAKAIVINRFEAHYLQQVMRIAQGNVSAAARIAGKERRALGKLLQKYSIDKSQFQSL